MPRYAVSDIVRGSTHVELTCTRALQSCVDIQWGLTHLIRICNIMDIRIELSMARGVGGFYAGLRDVEAGEA